MGLHITDKVLVVLILLVTINETIKEQLEFVILPTVLIVLITFIWLIANALGFLRYWKKNYLLSIYLFYVLICIVRGLTVAETYFEWKALYFNAVNLFIPALMYKMSDNQAVRVLKYIGIVGLPTVIVLLFLGVEFTLSTNVILGGLPGFVLASLYSKKFQFLFGMTLICLLFIGFSDARANSVRFIGALIAIISYKTGLYYGIKNYFILGFLFPLILAGLALTNGFNVFERLSSSNNRDGQSDTRSFIYVEALSSAISNDYLVLGRSPARGYDTNFFKDQLTVTGKNERFSSEIGIINILTWTGLIGVILYLLLIAKSLLYAVRRSQNIHLIILAVYTFTRYLLSFVEEFPGFNLSYISLWLSISLLTSEKLLNKSTKHFARFLRST